MAIVAGVDFGTLTVRVSIVDSQRGRLGSAIGEYPLVRLKEDPDHATQSPRRAHAGAGRGDARRPLAKPACRAARCAAIALDTTGSSVLPGGRGPGPARRLLPVVRPPRQGARRREITAAARRENLEAIDWCGGVYSSEWGFAKLLHWLRHNPDKREPDGHGAGALRHGGGGAVRHHRSRPGAAQRLRHGPQVDVERRAGRPAARGVPGQGRPAARRRPRQARRALRNLRPDRRARSSPEWAEKLGLRAGIPIPVGAFDAHWDAIGAGIREGDVVNVVGTSTCIMAIAREAGSDPGRLRRGAGLDSPRLHRHRGRAFGHRRHLRRHRPARRHDRGGALARAREAIAPARPACCASPGTTATAPCWSTPSWAA